MEADRVVWLTTCCQVGEQSVSSHALLEDSWSSVAISTELPLVSKRINNEDRILVMRRVQVCHFAVLQTQIPVVKRSSKPLSVVTYSTCHGEVTDW